jgi:hypothetical protein
MMIIVLASRRPSKLTQEVCFGYVDLKKKRVGYPSVHLKQFGIFLRNLSMQMTHGSRQVLGQIM